MDANPVSGEEACQRRGVPRVSRSVEFRRDTIGTNCRPQQEALQLTGNWSFTEHVGLRRINWFQFLFLLWNVYFQREPQGITELLNVSMPALKLCDFLLIIPDLDIPGSSVMISGCLDSLKEREGLCLLAVRHFCYLWQKEGFKRRIPVMSKFVHSIRRLPARAKQANNDSETDPIISCFFAVDTLWQEASIVADVPHQHFLKATLSH